MKDFAKQAEQLEQFKEMMKTLVPQIKPHKSGFEIRTKVLEFAQNQLWNDYHAKWGQFETSVQKLDDEIITSVKMPEVPGVDSVIEAAEKFYNFVNKKQN